MKRIFKHSKVLLLAIPVALISLAIGCGSPSEPAAEEPAATEISPVGTDTPATAPTDTLPTIDTSANGKPPVPIK